LIVAIILLVLGVADFFIPRNWIQNLNSRASGALPVIAPIFLKNNGELKKLNPSRVSESKKIEELFEQALQKYPVSKNRKDMLTPIFLWRLPNDLSKISDLTNRKKIFLQIMTPLILEQNSIILKDRARLELLKNKTILDMSNIEKNWIIGIAKYYKIFDNKKFDPIVTTPLIKELRTRLDIIPVALALAQSALETGWGTSRFAIFGNALFGQRTWDSKQGMRPLERDQDKLHSVRTFGKLSESVASYSHNLNSSPFYKSFRSERAKLRASGAPNATWGFLLTQQLADYSEDDGHYINATKNIMRDNQLSRLENLMLFPTPK
jgi:Bax protein